MLVSNFLRKLSSAGPIAQGVFAEASKLRVQGQFDSAESMLEHGAALAESNEGPASACALHYVHAMWTGAENSMRQAAKLVPDECDSWPEDVPAAAALASRALAIRTQGRSGGPFGEAMASLASRAHGPARAGENLRGSFLFAGAASPAVPALVRAAAGIDAASCDVAEALLPSDGQSAASAAASRTVRDAIADLDASVAPALSADDPESWIAASLRIGALASLCAALEPARSAETVEAANDLAAALNDPLSGHVLPDGALAPAGSRSAVYLGSHLALAARCYAARMASTGDGEDLMVATGLFESARRHFGRTAGGGGGGGGGATQTQTWTEGDLLEGEAAMLARVGKRAAEAEQKASDARSIFGDDPASTFPAAHLRWVDRGSLFSSWASPRA